MPIRYRTFLGLFLSVLYIFALSTTAKAVMADFDNSMWNYTATNDSGQIVTGSYFGNSNNGYYISSDHAKLVYNFKEPGLIGSAMFNISSIEDNAWLLVHFDNFGWTGNLDSNSLLPKLQMRLQWINDSGYPELLEITRSTRASSQDPNTLFQFYSAVYRKKTSTGWVYSGDTKTSSQTAGIFSIRRLSVDSFSLATFLPGADPFQDDPYYEHIFTDISPGSGLFIELQGRSEDDHGQTTAEFQGRFLDFEYYGVQIAVPAPGAVYLFGTAMIGLLGLRRVRMA